MLAYASKLVPVEFYHNILVYVFRLQLLYDVCGDSSKLSQGVLESPNPPIYHLA